jgi:hypothetical protein
MSITAAQLYTLVGEELGIVSGTMPVSPDDADKIARRHTPTRAWMIEEGCCYWPLNTIPDAAALPFAMVLAGQCAEVFGRGPRSEDPYTKGPDGFQLLKEHTSKRSAKERVQAEYF